jgi:transposase
MSDPGQDVNARLQCLETEVQTLRTANAALLAEAGKLQTQVEKLQAENAELRKGLAESLRAAKRQAAPFSRNKPKDKKKKPGRKAGDQHGKHGHRPEPKADAVDETFEVPLPDACPDCGGSEFKDVDTTQQFQEELPRKPVTRCFTIHRGTCCQCGKRVQGRHPLQTSDATGAAASQLGPDAQAAIVYFNKHAGMSYRKISDAFDKLHGITISPGGCAHIVGRAGERLEPALVEIHEKLKASEHITPDETGWRIGGRPVWLHAWVGDDGATAYAIDPQRGADALIRLIGIDYSGSMTHDGLASYGRFEEAVHQQCIDHALRRARELLARQSAAAGLFCQQVIDRFTHVLDLRDQLEAGVLDNALAPDVYEDQVDQLLELTGRPRRNADNQTFANHLHNHAAEWFVCLLDPSIPATNHRAEQALKTPIVNRKVFGGNQTATGARAQETTSSVLQTCKNRAVNFVSFVSDALCGCVAPLFAK